MRHANSIIASTRAGERLNSKDRSKNAEKIVAPKAPFDCTLDSMSPWGQRGRGDVIKSVSKYYQVERGSETTGVGSATVAPWVRWRRDRRWVKDCS